MRGVRLLSLGSLTARKSLFPGEAPSGTGCLSPVCPALSPAFQLNPTPQGSPADPKAAETCWVTSDDGRTGGPPELSPAEALTRLQPGTSDVLKLATDQFRLNLFSDSRPDTLVHGCPLPLQTCSSSRCPADAFIAQRSSSDSHTVPLVITAS